MIFCFFCFFYLRLILVTFLPCCALSWNLIEFWEVTLYKRLSNQEIAVNCRNYYTILEGFNSFAIVICYCISLFGLIIHSTIWPAAVAPVIKVIFYLGLQLILLTCFTVFHKCLRHILLPQNSCFLHLPWSATILKDNYEYMGKRKYFLQIFPELLDNLFIT